MGKTVEQRDPSITASITQGSLDDNHVDDEKDPPSSGADRWAALRSTNWPLSVPVWVRRPVWLRTTSNASTPAADPRQSSTKVRMKKSINLWAFPYPQRMSLRECLHLARKSGLMVSSLTMTLTTTFPPKRQRQVPGDPQDRRRDRHCDQRPVLVLVLAVLAHRQ